MNYTKTAQALVDETLRDHTVLKHAHGGCDVISLNEILVARIATALRAVESETLDQCAGILEMGRQFAVMNGSDGEYDRGLKAAVKCIIDLQAQYKIIHELKQKKET